MRRSLVLVFFAVAICLCAVDVSGLLVRITVTPLNIAYPGISESVCVGLSPDSHVFTITYNNSGQPELISSFGGSRLIPNRQYTAFFSAESLGKYYIGLQIQPFLNASVAVCDSNQFAVDNQPYMILSEYNAIGQTCGNQIICPSALSSRYQANPAHVIIHTMEVIP